MLVVVLADKNMCKCVWIMWYAMNIVTWCVQPLWMNSSDNCYACMHNLNSAVVCTKMVELQTNCEAKTLQVLYIVCALVRE